MLEVPASSWLRLLQVDCPNFEDMSWFEVLMFYGFREGVELDLDDPDTRLLPELVDRVLIKKITCKTSCCDVMNQDTSLIRHD